MIRRWILELTTRKSTRKLLSAGQYEWEHNFFLDLLLSLAPPLFHVPAVPAMSKQYGRKIYQHQTVVSLNILKASQLSITAEVLFWLMFNFLSTRTTDLFLLSCFLVSLTQRAHEVNSIPNTGLHTCPYPILSLSIQYRLFGAITTCHKPHSNWAKMHPTFVEVMQTLRSISVYKRSVTK